MPPPVFRQEPAPWTGAPAANRDVQADALGYDAESAAGGWQKLRVGVWTVMVGSLLGLAGLLGAAFAQLALLDQPRGPFAPAPSGINTALLAAGLSALVGGLTLFVGLLFCLSAPPGAGARPLAVAALSLFVAAVGVFFLIIAIVTQPVPSEIAVRVLSLIFAVSLLLSHFFFAFFLCSLGAALGRRRLLRNCILYAVGLFVFVAADVLWGIFGPSGPSPHAGALGLTARFSLQGHSVNALINIGILLLGLALVCTYVGVTDGVSRAIGKHLRFAQANGGANGPGNETPNAPPEWSSRRW
jgi:hypothetical protein